MEDSWREVSVAGTDREEKYALAVDAVVVRDVGEMEKLRACTLAVAESMQCMIDSRRRIGHVQLSQLYRANKFQVCLNGIFNGHYILLMILVLWDKKLV